LPIRKPSIRGSTCRGGGLVHDRDRTPRISDIN
jgi:hypothetical protein